MEQVLVSGAGPTGLALAIQLARYGVPLRIVDAAPTPSPWSKAIGIQARTLELFERMDVVEAFLAEGLKYRDVVVRSHGKTIVNQSLAAIPSRYNYVLALGQNRTEAILIEHLRSLGIEVERGTELVHLEQNEVRARVHLRGPAGETDAEFAYVAACDGAHSRVRHLLDIQFVGEPLAENFALADIHLDSDLPRDAISIFWSHGDIAAVFPLPGDRTRLIVERRAGFSADPTLDELRRILASSGAEVRACDDPFWVSRFTISQRRVASIAKGRVFLLGDAAHIHSPVGAQGMNTGIQDAENLAWKIALVLRNDATEALLASFAAEREPVAIALVRATGTFTRLAMNSNPAIEAVRDRVAAFASSIPAVGQRFRDAISEIGIVYAKSKIIVHDRHTPEPRPGSHAPDGAFVKVGDEARTSVFELIASLQHVLLIFTFRDDANVRAAKTAAQKHDGIVDAYVVTRDGTIPGTQLVDPPGAVFRAYAADGEPQYVLIRPDGYIAARGAARDALMLQAYMDRTFTPAP